MNTRGIAADILCQVVDEGKSLSFLLESILTTLPQQNDRAFVQALSFGVIRWYVRLDKILSLLTRKPIKDHEIKALALIGLYQLMYMRVKPHAAVSETVSASGAKTWAKPLLNGILRTFQRQQAELEEKADSDMGIRTAHPVWLVKAIKKDWPDQLTTILEANNELPPLVLRVNTSKTQRDTYLETLKIEGIQANASIYTDTAITLQHPVPVETLPFFSEGFVSVQDTSAQIAAQIMDVQPGDRVLDLCAAPGGKTAHLLERYPEMVELVAVDISADRLERISENLSRIGVAAKLIVGDAINPESWWDQATFNRILVDAPCSATGVIRRHPDIKLLRQPGDIQPLSEVQFSILNKAWSMLAPGGRLVYATCSIFHRENCDLVGRFLTIRNDAKEIPIEANWGIKMPHGRQILPNNDDMDGFYYACLEKD